MKKQNEDIEAIKQVAEAWRSGWLAGDADLLLSLYADEPVLMPQDHPAVAGKSAIRPLYEAVLKEFHFRSEGTVKEIVVSGDLGYFWSAYTLTATPKAGGEPTRVTGKSLFIVRREPGGAWKIARLIDNSDGATTDQDRQQEGERDGAANRSPPVGSGGSRTSAATDSRVLEVQNTLLTDQVLNSVSQDSRTL